jgi:hypothetical protein
MLPLGCRAFGAEAAALAMSLNRPFDAARVTKDSGAWAWTNNPQVK